MFNQIISIIISIVISLSSLFASSGIISDFREISDTSQTEFEVINKEYYLDDDNVAYSRYVDESGNEIELDKPAESILPQTRASAELPSSYDARNDNLVTSVKSQGSTGCCWAFSTCSALESSLISQGFETKDSVDLSEGHLSWFTNKSYVAVSDNILAGDGLNISNPFTIGGNWAVATFLLSTWSGAALESQYPFYATNTSKMKYAESERYSSSYHITSALDYSAANRNAVKQAVMDNGSVSASFYYAASYLKSSSFGYCYYQNSSTGTNHAVTIVGWNDDFPASYFNSAPSENGAWLVKNSWNTTWGTNGYFWLSYSDTSIQDYGVLAAVPADDFDNNYQYDGFGSISGLSYSTTSIYEANVFTAKSHEEIGGSGFYTYTDNMRCTIKLYKNLTSSSKPSSGTLLETQTISYPYSGYHTINFNDKYVITQGETFSVVINYTVDSGTAYAPCEGVSGRAFYSDDILVYYSSSAGQSYLSYNGSSWTDLSLAGYNNASIKVFTDNYYDKLTLTENSAVSIEDGNLIVGIYPNSITPDKLTSMFLGDVRISGDKLHTGTIVELYNSHNGVNDTGTVVVFGDVNSDGESDGTDAFIITLIVAGIISSQNLNAACLRAADCNNDGIVNDMDFNITFNSGLGIGSE